MEETKPIDHAADGLDGQAAYDVAIAAPIVNLRRKPNLKAEVVRQAQRGDTMRATGESGKWTALDGGLYVMTRLVERC